MCPHITKFGVDKWWCDHETQPKTGWIHQVGFFFGSWHQNPTCSLRPGRMPRMTKQPGIVFQTHGPFSAFLLQKKKEEERKKKDNSWLLWNISQNFIFDDEWCNQENLTLGSLWTHVNIALSGSPSTRQNVYYILGIMSALSWNLPC